MNWDEVVNSIDIEVFNQKNRHLKEVETIVLHGAWQGKTYEQMEKNCQYSLSYLRQAAGPKLWKLLSEVLNKHVTKSNFRVICEQLWSEPQLASGIEPRLDSTSALKVSWGEAPIVNLLWGREPEIELLQQQITREGCHLVTVFGMGGIGKTALAINFAQQMQAQFDRVIWRSLHYVAGAAELIEDLLQFLEESPSPRLLDESIDSKISTLIEHLRQKKCLIVLDTAAEIWQSGDLAGRYRQEYKGYGELLRRLGTESHQSCLLLCTREKPREVARLEGKASVYSLHLKGLSIEAGSAIFEEKQLSNPEQWGELIQLYKGNPLALKIVATTIQELFSGSVTAFLQQDTIVYGDIYDLLDEQFERLSILEQEIINWLAIAFKPLSLMQLRSNSRLPIDTAELIEALESLIRRSLIMRSKVKGETLFSLYQPVVAQYAISRLVENVCEEIEQVDNDSSFEQIEFLKNYALITDDTENHSQQISQIVVPIKNKLYRIFRDENAIEACLQRILQFLARKSSLTAGYAQQNIKAILEQLRLDIDNMSVLR